MTWADGTSFPVRRLHMGECMFEVELTYYLLAVFLVLGCAMAWAMNFVMLPGNWFIVGLASLFVLWVSEGTDGGMSWDTVGILVVLAIVGEVVEFMAGAAGAAKKGGARRSVFLALVGAFSGSIFGALAGVPIPVIGPLVGALAGAGFGAYFGAYLGETWKGRTPEMSMEVGKGAMIGRVLGTVGKLAVGTVMIGVVAVHGFT